VTNGDRSIDNINELECVGDQILANVWLTSSIIAIDAATGVVEGSIDASSLVPTEYRDDTGAVLNGIAYNPETNTYWLTGKLWPVMYEVTFTRA
jgi:glutamine cyclotransferase